MALAIVGCLLLAAVAAAFSCGTAFILSILLYEIIEQTSKYWNMTKIFCGVVWVILTVLIFDGLRNAIFVLFG